MTLVRFEVTATPDRRAGRVAILRSNSRQGVFERSFSPDGRPSDPLCEAALDFFQATGVTRGVIELIVRPATSTGPDFFHPAPTGEYHDPSSISDSRSRRACG